MVACEISGSIKCNSRLSGVPDLTLVFTDPSVLDDCSFHPCVRYSRYERDAVVSFVPPDGIFELMKYRVQVRQGKRQPVVCLAAVGNSGNEGSCCMSASSHGSRAVSPCLFSPAPPHPRTCADAQDRAADILRAAPQLP